MTDLNNLLSPFFLNDKEIRKVIELLFFSYRDFTSGPDKILEKLNFGRAHHRIIYFVGKTLSLTEKGEKLENQLSTIQIDKIKKVINKFSEENINGFKEILYDMIEADNKKTFQRIND